jgi:hypothetical protein
MITAMTVPMKVALNTIKQTNKHNFEYLQILLDILFLTDKLKQILIKNQNKS